MALTTEHLQRLQGAGLTGFFDQHRQTFELLAGQAYEYATTMVAPTGVATRVGAVGGRSGRPSLATNVDSNIPICRKGDWHALGFPAPPCA